MAASTGEPREAVWAPHMVLRSRAARTSAAPANHSPLRQVQAVDTTSDTSQVTDFDFASLSAEANRGQDSENTAKPAQAIAKRPRTEEFLGDRDTGNDSGAERHLSNCSKQVGNVLSEERRLHDAKMKLFQDCAVAVDNTLKKAGTDLHPYAKDFGTFFAECLQNWLTGSNPFVNKPKTAPSETNKTYAKVAGSGKALSPQMSPTVTRINRGSAQKGPAGKGPGTDLRVFIRMDNTHLEPYGGPDV